MKVGMVVVVLCVTFGCGPGPVSSQALDSLTKSYDEVAGSCWANGAAMMRYIDARRRIAEPIESDMAESIEASMKICSVAGADAAMIRRRMKETNLAARQ